MANETAVCRLDAIPKAEGCPAPQNCGASAYVPIPFPAVDEPVSGDYAADIAEMSADGTPLFRPEFDERYRTEEKRHLVKQQVTAAEDKAAKKKPSFWSRWMP